MATYEAKRYDFSGANITALNGSNVASGTVASARLADLATSKITSGTFADARISSGSVTQHVTAVTQATGTWTPSPSNGSFSNAVGRYVRVGGMCMVWGFAELTGRTDDNTTIYYVGGLPITSANVGTSGETVVGGGECYFRGSGNSTQMFPMVRANQSLIYFYSSGADAGTESSTQSNQFPQGCSGAEGKIMTNQNLREATQGATNDKGYWCLQYQV